MKLNVEKGKLDNLLKKFAQWREEYGQLLQQYDLKLQHKRDKQAMLNSEQVGHIFILSKNSFYPAVEYLHQSISFQVKRILVSSSITDLQVIFFSVLSNSIHILEEFFLPKKNKNSNLLDKIVCQLLCLPV